jgi:hypothetical protein
VPGAHPAAEHRVAVEDVDEGREGGHGLRYVRQEGVG